MSRRKKKPLWMDGAYLDPVLFQYQDAYHEELLERRIDAIAPYGWGVLDLALDLNALRAGVVKFDRFEAVLRDGALVRIGGDDGDVLPERAIDAALTRAERIDVYVALAQVDDTLPNMDMLVEYDEPRDREEGPVGTTKRLVPASKAPESARVPRYSTQLEEASDLSGHDRFEVPVARHNLRVSFGAEARDRVEAIKVLELVRNAAGVLSPRVEFVPTSLRIGVSPLIQSGIQRVFALMVAKQQALAASRRQRAASLLEFQAADAARFWLLHTLNTFLPSIREIAGAPTTHPARAKEKLGELVGALCSFATNVNPTDVPPYDHLAPGPGFDWILRAALALLDQAIAERFVEIPLERRGDNLHVGVFPNASLIHHAFFVALSGGQFSVRQYWENAPRIAKVASEPRVETLINQATHGAQLEAVEHPPGALPVKEGVAFFSIRKNEYWNEMVTMNSIALLVPIPGTHVALYAVDPQTLQ